MISTDAYLKTIPTELDGKRFTRGWVYRNVTGSPGGCVGRYDGNDGKTYRPFFKGSVDESRMGYPDDELRPLYGRQHRALGKDGDTLFVVEGEKCVDALHQLGQFAITSPGGANAVGYTDWSELGEYGTVIILPDNDDAGAVFARNVAEKIRSKTKNRDVRVANLPGLPDKGDVVDFIQHRMPEWDGYNEIPLTKRISLQSDLLTQIENVADVAISVAISNTTDGTGIIDGSADCRNVADVAARIDEAEFPIHALGPVLSDAVMAVHEAIQAPLSLCAHSMLAAATFATQHIADVTIDGRRSPLSEFFISVAESGERKSTLDSLALSAVRAIERTRQDEYRRQYAEYKFGLEQAKKYTKQLLNSAESDEETPSPPLEPAEPTPAEMIFDDVTIEGLQNRMTTGYPSMGIFCDEGGVILGGHSMKPENIMKSLSGFSNFWDGKSVKRLRVLDGARTLHGRRLTLHLMLQPIVSTALIGNDLAFDQGFLSRCLLVRPESTAGTRMYVSVDLHNDPRHLVFQKHMKQCLNTKLRLREDTTNELEPRVLNLSADARSVYIQFYNQVEVELRPDGLFHHIKGFANKAPEHALRLGAVVSIFEDPFCEEISAEGMQRGVELATFYLDEFVRIRGLSKESGEDRDWQTLLDWLKNHFPDTPFRVRDIQKSGPASIRRLKSVGILNLLDLGVRLDYLTRNGGKKEWTLNTEQD